ncbi:uncharacterized protein LOC135223025 [Macrobrachium nipponense]|uniref:uncharacterized protein LOC135223025 n=1 Tax=Macrobrachium nipponense TaxID=159736 RepID=UPI0030C7ACDF
MIVNVQENLSANTGNGCSAFNTHASVSRRIDEMAADAENQLVSKLQVNDFSLQLDESTLPDNSALLMAFVRFLDVDEICQEMIFALKLTTDTKGESIFKTLEVYFEENNIPLKNIVACACAAMMGRWLSKAVISTELLDDDLAVYVDHLKQLQNEMETRFSDLLQMTVPQWFVDPFIADASEVDVTLQESLIEPTNNTTAQARFKRGGHQKLWMIQDVYEKYPLLWKDVTLLLLAFPTSCLVETGFSRVMYLLSDTKSP